MSLCFSPEVLVAMLGLKDTPLCWSDYAWYISGFYYINFLKSALSPDR